MKNYFSKDYILVQGIYYLLCCLIFVFAAFTLLARGLSSSMIGLTFSLGQLLNIFIQYIVSEYLDRNNNVSVFEASLWTAATMIILCIFNVILKVSSIYLVIVNILIMGINESLTPLTNSFTAIYEKAGYVVHFGVARAVGSLSFALGSFVYGLLTKSFTYHIITYSMVVSNLILLVFLYFANKHYKQIPIKIEREKKENIISTRSFLSNHKLFIVLCLGYGLLMASSGTCENFTLQIISRIGGTSVDNGLIQGLKALVEVPIIFNFHRIEKKLSIRNIYWIAGICYIFKSGAWLTDSLLIIYLSQFLQMVSFSLLLPVTVSYISKIMSKQETSRGYAVQTIISSLISVGLNAIAGIVIDRYGVYKLSFICFLITVLGTTILLVAVEKLLPKVRK